MALSHTECAWFNHTHFTEKILSVEGVHIGRETARGIRREGWHPSRETEASCSASMPAGAQGMMVLRDGSVHRWFRDEHPPCCLISAIDDDTGRYLVGRVLPFESSEGYLWVFRRMARGYGIFPSIYRDLLAAELHRAVITERERSPIKAFPGGFLCQDPG